MERTQFTFYASFFSAIKRIKKASDRAAIYDAICLYALTGEMPDMTALPDTAAMAFELIKPTLDTSRKKAESGAIGGSVKQTESKHEANDKQTAREKEIEIDIEKEIDIYNPPIVPPTKKPTKHKYGQYENVLLSDEDMSKLKAEFPDYEQRIERLSEYIASKGAKYKDHLATIRAWARKDKPKQEQNKKTDDDYAAYEAWSRSYIAQKVGGNG